MKLPVDHGSSAPPYLVSRTLLAYHGTRANHVQRDSAGSDSRRFRRCRGATHEVLVRTRRGRPALALVLGADPGAAIRMLGGAGQPEQTKLPDLHSGPQRDGQIRDVGQLERDMTAEPRIDEPGGRVGQQAQPAERRLPLQPAGEIVWQSAHFEG